ncbi:MAG: TusE/DsrC/DsvC family sulfur relay protein [Nitrospirota bacterium]|jgi:TusE/DsrC/DsvC family sulfur relay protein
MPEIEYDGGKVKVDAEGYLVNFDDWNEDVARALAKREGIGELSADRLDILKFIRQYYTDYGSYPVFGAVCLNVMQPKDCVTKKFMNPIQAWRVAGIPNPGKEVETYLHHEVV